MEQPEAQKRQRKPRSDKGLVLMTERDQYCLQWIADQYAVRLDQAQRLLSRWPGGELKDKRRGLAPTTVKDLVNRWQRAGWIEYQRVLVGQPGWMWITKKGLRMIGWDDFYTARMPASTRLNHLYAVNQVRLLLDTKGFSWKSEREYRTELESMITKGRSLGPIPDAVIESPETGTVAVEVELTAKKPDDLRRKLQHLVDQYEAGYTRAKFPTIWFYVPDEKLQRAVERARESLKWEKDQERISVAIFHGLL
jgi:hypothetical protein